MGIESGSSSSLILFRTAASPLSFFFGGGLSDSERSIAGIVGVTGTRAIHSSVIADMKFFCLLGDDP